MDTFKDSSLYTNVTREILTYKNMDNGFHVVAKSCGESLMVNYGLLMCGT